MAIGLSEKVESESSRLLDTDIETGIWAIGITDNSISTDVDMVDGSVIEPENLVGESDTPLIDAEVAIPAPKRQFDFIHIRYRGDVVAKNEGRVFKAAFEQTKPGGWIEVVDNGRPADGIDSKLSPLRKSSIRSAASIRRRLLEAGFVDVEEKRLSRGSGPSGPLQRIGNFLSSVFSMSWVWSGDAAISGRCRGSCGLTENPGIFVIARRPR